MGDPQRELEHLRKVATADPTKRFGKLLKIVRHSVLTVIGNTIPEVGRMWPPPRQYFTGEPDAAMSCPSGSEGAGRRRTSAMGQRAALRPYASQMLAAGMSIVSLQRYLGHENLNTTMIYAEVSDPLLQKDYYRGAATFDPASAELARQFLDLSQKDELRQLIAELKYPELEPQQRKKILEQMENLLDESEEASDMPGQSS